MNRFTGTKLALINTSQIVGILRDNNPEISFPDMWDVTGGTRENNESPVECAFREAKEELSLDLKEDSIIWCREYEHLGKSSPGGYFMVACVTDEQLSKVRLGNEGQYFKLHDMNDFIKLRNIVPFVRERLMDYINDRINNAV
ncbi:NUDIX domain-containing protein [Yersinia mollaretii]|uniref:NUDIX domain-containing protein n=1 Tax=Yersinia mollaretii TaxID=33060 RepID=UPI0011A5FD54|nr:NUDIX hydrolase [Yersinia mollaretii]